MGIIFRTALFVIILVHRMLTGALFSQDLKENFLNGFDVVDVRIEKNTGSCINCMS